MRSLLAIVLAGILAAPLVPIAAGQTGDQVATLLIEVGADHAEAMTLTFEGLRPLTRYQGICLPARATETRVYDAAGDVDYEAKNENGRRAIEFTARSDRLVVEMTRAAPPATDAPFYAADVNFCVPANSAVSLTVRVPQDHTLFFVSDGGTITGGREGTTTSEGPTHVFYSYEAPPTGSDVTVFDEGPFRVVVKASLEAQAREVARLAAGPLDAALAEAGLPAPFDTMRVIFQETTPHPWEAGHYNGHGYVAVKESTIAAGPEEGYPYGAVKVLVHESFHAASFPFGRGIVEDDLAWWLEGTARHSERHVDAAMPNATTHCERSSAEVKCWNFDDRLTRAELEAGYHPDFAFDSQWEPSLPQTDETRRFYYAFSEFIVASYIQQNGVERYRAIWDEISAAFETGEGCPCVDGWLLSIIAEPQLFRPWGNLRASDPSGFEARVTGFLKDEDALRRALDERASPLGDLGVPGLPVAIVLAFVGIAALARRRDR